MERKAPLRYSVTAQTLHWLTAILVLVAFIYGLGGSEERVYSAARDFDRQLHETLGLSVLVLLALRVVWRALDTRPSAPKVVRWMEISAKIMQAVLYFLLFAVPLTAIAGAWFEGHALTLLAGIQFSPLVAESHELGATIAEIHTLLGDAIIWLAGAHAVAGLFHHYVLKDGVLKSMFPRWAIKDPS